MKPVQHKKVGFKEIALRADVAISTVSHVLNGTAPISPEVRARVLEAAGQLGYLAKRREKASIAVLRSILLAVPSDTLPHNEFNLFSWTLLSTLMREMRAARHSRRAHLGPSVDGKAVAHPNMSIEPKIVRRRLSETMAG